MFQIDSDPDRRGGYRLHAETVVPAPLEEVFEFFSNAENLERLTPNWMHFNILTPTPLEMRVGLMIDYRIKILGIPMKWRSEITIWEPGRRFVDEQRIGPYRYWEHEHTFEQVEGGTRVTDHVQYGVPGGALVHRLRVKPDLVKIFTYREEQQHEIFGSGAPRTDTTGASVS